jgi:hypothetical protein
MIPKSGHRFSEEIMLKQKREPVPRDPVRRRMPAGRNEPPAFNRSFGVFAMSTTAAGVLVQGLLGWDIDTVFGIPGDGIDEVLEAFETAGLGRSGALNLDHR